MKTHEVIVIVLSKTTGAWIIVKYGLTNGHFASLGHSINPLNLWPDELQTLKCQNTYASFYMSKCQVTIWAVSV